MLLLIRIFAFVLTIVGCQESKTTKGSGSENSEAIPTSALQISGSISNGEDISNTSVVKSQSVSVVRNDGVTVGQATTDSTGAFSVALPVGALVVGTSYDLTAASTETETETETATTSEYSYTLEAKVPNDGHGKALGFKRKLDISTKNVRDGSISLGESKLKEISAIVGTVTFAELIFQYLG